MTSDQWRVVRRASTSLLILTTTIIGLIIYQLSSTDLGGSLNVLLLEIPVILFCVASFAAYAEDHVGSRLPAFGISSVILIYITMLSGTILEVSTNFSNNLLLLKTALKVQCPVLFIAFSIAVMAPRLHTKYKGIKVVTHLTGSAIALIVLLNVCGKQSEQFLQASLVVITILFILLTFFSAAFIVFYRKCRKDFR